MVNKNVDPSEVGALIFLSHSGDSRTPATDCVLHNRLELSRECAAFDISLGCSGYPYGLFQTASLMSNSDINTAILICAETMTKIVSPNDRSSAQLFGDCGTATLLRKSNKATALNGVVKTDGTGYQSIIVPAGGFRNRFASTDAFTWHDGNHRSLHDLYMNGTAVLEFTLTQVPDLLNHFLATSNLVVDNYDSVVFHQANLHILKQLSRKLAIPLDKIPISLDRFGNTSSASIPLTLCNTYSSNLSSESLKILMCGFGVGLSLGVVSADISPYDILPIIYTSESYDEGIINSPSDLRSVKSSS
jgi:3-oxoacyl-[acyl-carrier-protein] synthase-3